MNKSILLVEPGYKTKYPPLGLMKISTYHKMQGDQVTFVKGCNNKVLDEYWDRVYISTLFTYTWAETVKTIKFYSEGIFGFSRKIFVGGIIASLMPEDLFDATGVRPVEGLLNDTTKIEQDDDIIIDDLPPDYSILNQINSFVYKYTDSYIGYSTRGCIRKCDFCAVSRFEPQYVPYKNIKKMMQDIDALYGQRQNLLLMDNNVLASNCFDKIIDDIKAAGFVKGATFGPTRRKRIVDFNQGLDARLLTEEKMKRLSEIPLQPMRIAFDDIKFKKTYVEAVRLAHRYGQKDMSNYVLYNHEDTPEDFYERLSINIDLNEEFTKKAAQGEGVKTIIYSFPMRCIPIGAKTRDVDTGNRHWNKRYLRGLQVILSVIRGPVMTGKRFFQQAFGRDADEFKAILCMPDEFIRNRLKHNWSKISNHEKQWAPHTKHWMKTFRDLGKDELDQLVMILSSNSLKEASNAYANGSNKKIRKLLKCHLEAENIVKEYRHDKQE
jgi:hypothetical protein